MRRVQLNDLRVGTISFEYGSGIGAHWPFLSDAGCVVQKDLHIAEYTDPLHIQ